MFISTTDIAKPVDRIKGYHIGIVVNNKDPKKLGAVQLRIPGLIDGPDPVLPWASAIQPPGLGGSGNARTLVVPNIGAQVVCTVVDSYTIHYRGWLPTKKIDNDALAQDYPYSYGVIDEQGTGYRVNRKSQVMEVTHSSGTKITIDKTGTVTIASAKDIIMTGTNIKLTASASMELKSNAFKNENAQATDSTSGVHSIKAGSALSLTGSPLSLNG